MNKAIARSEEYVDYKIGFVFNPTVKFIDNIIIVELNKIIIFLSIHIIPIKRELIAQNTGIEQSNIDKSCRSNF